MLRYQIHMSRPPKWVTNLGILAIEWLWGSIPRPVFMCAHVCVYLCIFSCVPSFILYGMATISRLTHSSGLFLQKSPANIGLFCKEGSSNLRIQYALQIAMRGVAVIFSMQLTATL